MRQKSNDIFPALFSNNDTTAREKRAGKTVKFTETSKRRDSAQHLVRRVQIILLASESQLDFHIAPQVGLYVKTVRLWRHRWNAQQETLNAVGILAIGSDIEVVGFGFFHDCSFLI